MFRCRVISISLSRNNVNIHNAMCMLRLWICLFLVTFYENVIRVSSHRKAICSAESMWAYTHSKNTATRNSPIRVVNTFRALGLSANLLHWLLTTFTVQVLSSFFFFFFFFFSMLKLCSDFNDIGWVDHAWK